MEDKSTGKISLSSQGPTVPEPWDPWKLAKELGIIKTEFHLSGQHDQGSHGHDQGGSGPSELQKIDAFGESLARKYHAGQTDKDGNDYIDSHLRPVASTLPARLRLAGWLHDSLEDTDATPESLKADGVDDHTISIIKALTHPDGEPYEKSIQRVIDAGPDAVDVKIADMTNNLGKSRALPEDHPNKAKWLAKYGPRLEQLHEARKNFRNVIVVEFHLLGQHDQTTHGHPQGGASIVSKASAEEHEDARVDIKKKAISAKGKAGLHKAETDLENLRDKIQKDLKNADGDEARDLSDTLRQTKKDLNSTRRKLYTDDELAVIETAESLEDQKGSLDSYMKFMYRDKIGQHISDGVTESLNYQKEVVQGTSRGKKFPGKTQPVGTSFPKGEWPDPAGLRDGSESTRKFSKIDDAGLIGKTDVNGVKVKRAYEITAKDGTKIKAYDFSGIREPKRVQEIMNSQAYLHELYPMKPQKDVVFMSGGQTARRMGSSYVGAWVFMGSDYTFVNEKAQKWNVNKLAEKDHFMPAGKTASSTHYLLTHEYGHQFDFTNKRNSAGLYENKNIKKHLSKYGKSNPAEAYAEAFADWHVSQGQTKNPASIAYARHEKWYGADKKTTAGGPGGVSSGRTVRTPEGAKLYGVPVGSKIPTAASSWDLWELAMDMGIITFAEETEADMKIPANVPVIVEDFEGGNPEARNIKFIPATEEEKTDAETIAKEVWAELGLEWEE